MDISKISANYNYVFGECRMAKVPHHFVNRCYPFIVVVYVESGIYYARVGRELYEIRAGEALVVPEFVAHDVYMTEPGSLSWAHVSAHIFSRDLLSMFQIPVVYRGEDAEQLGATARELSNLSGLRQNADLLPRGRTSITAKPVQSDADVYAKADIASMLDADMLITFRLKAAYDEKIAKIVHVILERAESMTMLNDDSYRWVADVSRYIHDRIRTQISLEQLAAHFHMSVRKFSAEFRRFFPQSPIDYVINEKIKFSTWLLLNGRNVKTVALELGFSDSYYFTRQFKKRMGCSPSQYKDSYVKQLS